MPSIHFFGFWPGFYDNSDIINIEFFMKNFFFFMEDLNITENINDAQIIVYSVFLIEKKIERKLKRLKRLNNNLKIIQWTGESTQYDKNYSYTDLCLSGYNHEKNIPLLYSLVYLKSVTHDLQTIEEVPLKQKKFCVFMCSNPNAELRLEFHKKLNQYKQIDSYGIVFNNRFEGGYYWTKEFLNFISNYKFVLCFENTKRENYNTEKIINPILAKTIPIYWGHNNITKIINQDSFLMLENESEQDIDTLIEKIKIIDQDDDLYNKILNLNHFNYDSFDELQNSNYGVNNASKKLKEFLI